MGMGSRNVGGAGVETRLTQWFEVGSTDLVVCLLHSGGHCVGSWLCGVVLIREWLVQNLYAVVVLGVRRQSLVISGDNLGFGVLGVLIS